MNRLRCNRRFEMDIPPSADQQETHPMNRILRIVACLAAGAGFLASPLAQAQATGFPDKPIRMIVTFPPGGSTDAVVRLLLPKLEADLGQQVIVDNRPGAGGNIGLSIVARAAPDGYTVGVGAAGALSANASLYAQMPFDPIKDFEPVTLLAAIPFVIIGNPSLEAKTLADVITLAKTRPGGMSIAHGGNGTAMHLSAALLGQMAGVKFVAVPYRGSGPAALSVLADQTPLGVVDLASALQHIKAGKLVAYAVTSPQRVPTLPDVPTVSEAGQTGYDSTGWFGVVAPAGTPAAVVARLNAAITSALRDEQVQASLRKLGVEPAPSTSQAFAAYIRSETQKWAGVIKTAGIERR
jgi:tripartite-type tricarboxylate transporter receptor subunit TctC